MSKLKKLMAIALALVMALALMVPAMADGETYSITIKNSNNLTVSIIGKTYYAYKVFDLTLGGAPTYTLANKFEDGVKYYAKSGDTYTVATGVTSENFGNGMYYIVDKQYSAYAYRIKNTDWAFPTLKGDAEEANEIITNYGIVLKRSATDPNVYIVDNTGMSKEHARALADALQRSGLPNSANGTAKATTSEDVTINLDTPGYYAVYGTATPKNANEEANEELVAAVALTTTEPTAVVVPKVEVPTLDKKIVATTVLDGGDLSEGEVASIRGGNEVAFKIVSSVPDKSGYTDYRFEINDEMSSGLKFKGTDTKDAITDLKVMILSGSEFKELDSNQFYIKHEVGTKKFKLTIPFDTLKNFSEDAPIHVTYPAILDGKSRNSSYEKNIVTLTYSSSPYDSSKVNITLPEVTYIVNVNIDVDKFDSKSKNIKLAGAEFKLYKKSGDLPGDDENVWYKLNDNNEVIYTTKANATTFTTNADGNLQERIRGLAVNHTGVTYGLVETTAPAGYNLMSEPVVFQLRGDYKATDKRITIEYKIGNNSWQTVSQGSINVGSGDTAGTMPYQTIPVSNGTSLVLPETGGAGLYIVAGVAIVALLGFGGTAMLKRKVNGED